MLDFAQHPVGTTDGVAKQIIVDAYYDICTPDMVVTGSFDPSYEYHISAQPLEIPIPEFVSGDCESQMSYGVDDVFLNHADSLIVDWLVCDGCWTASLNKKTAFTPNSPK